MRVSVVSCFLAMIFHILVSFAHCNVPSLLPPRKIMKNLILSIILSVNLSNEPLNVFPKDNTKKQARHGLIIVT